jgi:hypothetical protein
LLHEHRRPGLPVLLVTGYARKALESMPLAAEWT